MRVIILPLFLILAGSAGFAADDVEVIPESELAVELITLTGEPRTPLQNAEASFSVLIFTTTDCPVANAFAPEMQRIEALIRESGGQMTYAHVDPELKIEDAQRHAKDFGLSPGLIVIDRTHDLVKATGAELTPEAALIAPDGRLIYRGRINDLFVDYGSRRREPSRHDLREAISAFLTGKPLAEARTEAIGCYIPGT